IFEGLEGYEVVMLVLGALTFVLLMALTVFLTLRKRSIKQLVMLFPMPIIMMGFPGISKIKFEGNLIDIETKTKAVEKNPNDTKARAELAKQVVELQSRP